MTSNGSESFGVTTKGPVTMPLKQKSPISSNKCLGVSSSIFLEP